MHVMEIASGQSWNGAAAHCQLVSRELAARGHRVTVVCLEDSELAERLAGDPVEVVHSDLHRWPGDELKRIAGIARTTDVDVLHTHSSRAHFFGILLRFFNGFPCVATAHARHFQLHWMFNDLVIAVSEATRRYQHRRNFVRDGRMVTIHNFIDERAVVAVSDSDRAATRASFGVDDRACLIGNLGFICWRKGQLDLVRAMPQILAESPDTRLLLVGTEAEHEYADQARMEACELGVEHAITWTGHRQDVARILAALDIYVQPSNEEPLGMAIIEAMAVGLPAVGTAVGGIPECITDGQTGTLVPAGDSDALAEALLEFIRDPERRARFGRAGRKSMEKRFSAATQVPKLEAALASVIRSRRRRAA